MGVRSEIGAECDAIEQWRAAQPPITTATASGERLLQWLTDAAQRYARHVDAGQPESAAHCLKLMTGYREEILRRMGAPA